MSPERLAQSVSRDAAKATNRQGANPFVIVCDHTFNVIPETTGDIRVGVNRPYSPTDRVCFTLTEHARRRGLPCAMIEIRVHYR